MHKLYSQLRFTMQKGHKQKQQSRGEWGKGLKTSGSQGGCSVCTQADSVPPSRVLIAPESTYDALKADSTGPSACHLPTAGKQVSSEANLPVWGIHCRAAPWPLAASHPRLQGLWTSLSTAYPAGPRWDWCPLQWPPHEHTPLPGYPSEFLGFNSKTNKSLIHREKSDIF